MSPNPFFVGGPVPPNYFVGRTSEIRIAFNQISQRAHLAIYGSAGMGKSSLLRYLSEPEIWQKQIANSSQAIIIYLNCTGIEPFTASAFWHEILSLLQDEISLEDELQEQIKKYLAEETLETADMRRILRQIGQRNQYLVLLLDDYDVALRTNSEYTEADMLKFLREFRDLAVHRREGQYLSTIVTSFCRLNELGPQLTPSGSPWYNHYLFQPLKPFSSEEVNNLFFQPKSSLFIPIYPSLKEGVLAITDGHPALLQNAGYLLYDQLRDGKIPNIEAFTKDFESRTEQYFRDIWLFSTEVEQVLLMLIALSRLEGHLHQKRYDLGDIDLIFSQRSRELLDLEERGVIQHTILEGKPVYNFASSMMEWWVIRELENSTDIQIKQREKMFLNLMSRAQAAQLTKVIEQVWQQREALKTVLFYIIRKLGGSPV